VVQFKTSARPEAAVECTKCFNDFGSFDRSPNKDSKDWAMTCEKQTAGPDAEDDTDDGEKVFDPECLFEYSKKYCKKRCVDCVGTAEVECPSPAWCKRRCAHCNKPPQAKQAEEVRASAAAAEKKECREAQSWLPRLEEWHRLCTGLKERAKELCPGTQCAFEEALPEFPEDQLLEQVPKASKFQALFREEVQTAGWVPKVGKEMADMAACLRKNYHAILDVEKGSFSSMCPAVAKAKDRMAEVVRRKEQLLSAVLEAINPLRDEGSKLSMSKEMMLENTIERKCPVELNCNVPVRSIFEYAPPCDVSGFKQLINNYNASVARACDTQKVKESPFISYNQAVADYLQNVTAFFKSYSPQSC